MSNWSYLVVVCIILFAFLCRQELKRRNKDLLILRFVSTAIAIASLLLLAYPNKTESGIEKTNKVILLTPGTIADSLVTFLKGKVKAIPVFAINQSVMQGVSGARVKLMPDLFSLSDQFKTDTLHVFGNGFTREQLMLLGDRPFVFHARVPTSSVISIFWQHQVVVGNKLLVQGKYSNVGAGETKIMLQAFHQTVDSTIVQPKMISDFSLSTTPRNFGKALYTLLVTRGKDTLEYDPIPIKTIAAVPIKILFLSSSPGFENTFLKNRLAQMGYQISATTQISKNRNDRQFLNRPEQPGKSLDGNYLDQFDLVIADEDALTGLNNFSLAALRKSIIEKGTGLLLKITDEKNKRLFYSSYFPAGLLKEEKKSFSLIREFAQSNDLYKIKIEEPVSLHQQPGTQVLLQDEHANIFAAAVALGNGKVVATTLTNTFSMALAGENSGYQSLWSLLLEKAAKKISPDESWQQGPLFPMANDQTQIQKEASTTGSLQGQIDNASIYLAQDSLLSYRWHGTYWPREEGWASLIQSDGKIVDWYIYGPKDWQKMINSQNLKETNRYIQNHSVLANQQEDQQDGKGNIPLKAIALVLFFLCCTFLWIEQKSK